jgi:hypothetical protein
LLTWVFPQIIIKIPFIMPYGLTKSPSALCDPLLASFLDAGDEVARGRELERLMMDHVRPVVEAVVGRHARRDFVSRPEDSEDIEGAVTLRVIRRLRELAAGEGEPIEKLVEYVATLARNAATDALRARYPEAQRLRRKVRRILGDDDRFALWTGASAELLGGTSAWRGRDTASCTITPDDATEAMCDGSRPAAALLAIFERAGGPVAFDDLVRLLSKLWSIAEVMAVDAEVVVVADQRPSPLHEYENRRYLETLWSEVQALRAAQRAALLLNLRDVDGSNALALLTILEIATFDQIATALEIAPQRLAELWGNLPLDDNSIAALLGVSRQQVINLRRAARERLMRRMK